MARIKIDGIIDYLGPQVRKALRDTLHESFSDISFDEYDLFRRFRRSLSRKCNIWESVPDHYIEELE